MAYEKSVWSNGPAGNTPITAAKLNHLETQYDEALAAVQATGYAKTADYNILGNSYVWSMANNASGAGPGGVSIDATAAANVPRDTTAKRSEGYIAIGRDALGAATRARNCIAIGSKALGVGNPGFGNLAIGVFALANVNGQDEFAATIPGSRNIGIGSLAGYFVNTGYMNTFMGRDAGQTVTDGYYNVALGYRAGTSGIAPVGLDGSIINQYPVSAIANTSVGTNAGALLTGSNNTIVGSSAGQQLRNSPQNTIIGQYAANNLGRDISENNLALSRVSLTGTYSQSGSIITVSITGHGAVAGNKVMVQFTSGEINAVSGETQWMAVATVTNANTFTIVSPMSMTGSGNVSLSIVETSTAANVGGQNTILGQNAMSGAPTSAGNQTVLGESAGISSTGACNTIVGSRAGYNLTTGESNTFVGYNAGRTTMAGGGLQTYSGCVALGRDTSVSGDNQVQLGGSSTTTYVYGTVQNRSDERDKADIQETALGLDWVVNHPRPKDYRWDMREDYIEYDDEGAVVAVHDRDGSKKRERLHHGVIAQDVEAYIEETGVDFGGYQDHTRGGGSDVKSIGYDEYIAPLLAAIQDLHAIVVKQGQEIAELKS